MSIKDNWINKKIIEIVKGCVDIIDTKQRLYNTLSEFYDMAEKIHDDIEDELWPIEEMEEFNEKGIFERRKIMEEVYTCICGGQSFIIFNKERIECNECGRIYRLDESIQIASNFNEKKKILCQHTKKNTT